MRVRVLPHLPDENNIKDRSEEIANFGRKDKETMSEKERWYKRFWTFLKESRAELKKVTWPSRNEVYSTTLVVIIATVFFGFFLYFMDILFSWAILQIRAVF